MHLFLTVVFIFAFSVMVTVHNVILKYASQNDTWSKSWLILMGAGYIVGILAPFFQVLAFKNNNPAIVLAIIGGILTPLLYTTMFLVFQIQLTRVQWVGIALACLGAILVQFGPMGEAKHPLVSGDAELSRVTSTSE